MAASSKSMLESLLARVRERSREERPQSSRRQSVPPLEVVASAPAAPSPVAVAMPLAEDEIEEYEDELIEILDEDESEPPPSSALPLELSPSVPQVEMRRHEAPPGAPALRPARPVAVPELQVERVDRPPLAPLPVASTRSRRPEARQLPFVELLDASMKLGR